MNADDWSGVADKEGYTGFALYPSVAVNDNFGLGLRAEYFKAKENAAGLYGIGANTSVTALTFTANLKSGGLTFIPEFRIDGGKNDMFYKSDMTTMTKSASQISLAMVYGF